MKKRVELKKIITLLPRVPEYFWKIRKLISKTKKTKKKLISLVVKKLHHEVIVYFMLRRKYFIVLSSKFFCQTSHLNTRSITCVNVHWFLKYKCFGLRFPHLLNYIKFFLVIVKYNRLSRKHFKISRSQQFFVSSSNNFLKTFFSSFSEELKTEKWKICDVCVKKE